MHNKNFDFIYCIYGSHLVTFLFHVIFCFSFSETIKLLKENHGLLLIHQTIHQLELITDYLLKD